MLTAATHELSDAEILSRFGSLLAEADYAFRVDPDYVCQMAEAAARVVSAWTPERRMEVRHRGRVMSERREPKPKPTPKPEAIPAPKPKKPRAPRAASIPKNEERSLTEEVVSRRTDGQPIAEVARALYISEMQVKRLSWSGGFKGRRPNPILTPVERILRDQKIRLRFSQLGNYSAVAEEFGLSRPAVRSIVNADTHT